MLILQCQLYYVITSFFRQESVNRPVSALEAITLLKEDDKLQCGSEVSQCIAVGQTETSTILIAKMPYIRKSFLILLRLKQSVQLGNLAEIPAPVRFVNLILSPDDDNIDIYQSGRAMGALMSDSTFGGLAKTAEVMCNLIEVISSKKDLTQTVLNLLVSSLYIYHSYDIFTLLRYINSFRDVLCLYCCYPKAAH